MAKVKRQFGFKVTTAKGMSPNATIGSWQRRRYKYRLPESNDKPGKWFPVRKNLSMCHVGWHYYQSLRALKRGYFAYALPSKHYKVFLCEVKGNIIHTSEKSVAEEMRLIMEISPMPVADVDLYVRMARKMGLL